MDGLLFSVLLFSSFYIVLGDFTYFPNPKSYENARNFCRSFGGNLVAINSVQRKDIVIDMIDDDAIWVGLYSMYEIGWFVFEDETAECPNKFSGACIDFWRLGHPRCIEKYKGYKCVSFYPTDDVIDNDVNCNEEKPFICSDIQGSTESTTIDPTSQPTAYPSSDPSSRSTYDPTSTITSHPTSNPTKTPTTDPTNVPTRSPSTDPTNSPSTDPTQSPTVDPTFCPYNCCLNRPVGQRGPDYDPNINCNLLHVVFCTNADDSCIWDCDEYRENTHRRGEFIGFDSVTGHNNEDIVDEDQIIDRGEPQSIDELITRSIFVELDTCRTVYEYDLLDSVASQRLADLSTIYQKMAQDETGNIADPNDILIQDALEDDAVTPRRLTVFNNPDGRKPSLLQNVFPSRVIGLLVDGNGEWCTGTLVSRRVVLTAAHCIYDTNINSFIGGWTFYPDTVSGKLGAAYTWIQAGVPKRWKDLTTDGNSAATDADYGYIRLKPANTNLGWMSWGYDNSIGGVKANTFGYPGDLPPREARYFQYCDYTDWFSEQITTNKCDIAGGQSGSPIYLYWSKSNKRIIYAVTSGYNLAFNAYTRIDGTKFHTICDLIDKGETSLNGC